MSEYNIQMNKYNALNVEYDQLYPATKIGNVDGLNTALQNKAPAGYGLGGNGTEVSDWNNATANGFYRDGKGTEAKHSPFVGIWTCGYVTNYSSGALVQVAFGFPFVNGKYVQCEKHRGYHNGGWGEWEWVNPPMELGVEYRTTERFNGKPVYVKAIDFGALPNNDRKNVSIGASIAVALSCNLSFGKSGTYTYSAPFYGGADIGGISVTAHITGSNVCCVTTSDYSDFTAVALCKYTKSTD